MSHQLKARAPAWSGFTPAPEAFQPADGEIRTELGIALGLDGRILARASPVPLAESFYYFLPEADHRPLFLKVISEERLAQQLAADRIATWLYDQGIPTSRILPSFPRPMADGRYLLGYELIDGAPAARDASVLPKLGRSLARMHQHLRTLPGREEIRDSSKRRDQSFREGRERLLDHSRLDPSLHSIIQAASTDLPSDSAQVLHGDLNLGNVLFEAGDRRPVLLDFEDALHNHHSPGVDLAMLIERFILVRQADDAQALAACAQLLSGYREISDPAWPATSLAGVLRTLSIRALVLLHLNAGAIDQQEQDKFVQLIHQTVERSELLKQIERL